MISEHNLKWSRDPDGVISSRPASTEELARARDEASNSDVGMRSCWNCNAAHAHLIDREVFLCLGCGRYFHKGIDITEQPAPAAL